MKMGQKKHPQSFLKTFHPHYIWGKPARGEILPPLPFNTALFNWPELKKIICYSTKTFAKNVFEISAIKIFMALLLFNSMGDFV